MSRRLRVVGISGCFVALFLFTTTVQASDFWARDCFSVTRCRDINPYKPRTMAGIQRAYRWYVHSKDGINKEEARVIAQYMVITEYLHHSVDYRKPKVVGDDDETWKVRFPGKFNLTKGLAEEYIFCVNKRDGKITCQKILDP